MVSMTLSAARLRFVRAAIRSCLEMSDLVATIEAANQLPAKRGPYKKRTA